MDKIRRFIWSLYNIIKIILVHSFFLNVLSKNWLEMLKFGFERANDLHKTQFLSLSCVNAYPITHPPPKVKREASYLRSQNSDFGDPLNNTMSTERAGY